MQCALGSDDEFRTQVKVRHACGRRKINITHERGGAVGHHRARTPNSCHLQKREAAAWRGALVRAPTDQKLLSRLILAPRAPSAALPSWSLFSTARGACKSRARMHPCNCGREPPFRCAKPRRKMCDRDKNMRSYWRHSKRIFDTPPAI